MSIGTNIKFQRKKNDLTQRELAKKMNLSNRTISSWEVDRNYPRVSEILKMCDIFHCSAAELTDYKIEVPNYDKTDLEILLLIQQLNKEQKTTVIKMLRSFVEN